MSRRMKVKSRVLEAVGDTARDLYRLGFITKRKLEQYNALCFKPVPAYSSKKIQALRKRYNLSQVVLAAVLNMSPSTVQKWEIGEKHPSGPSLKLLYLLDKNGIEGML